MSTLRENNKLLVFSLILMQAAAMFATGTSAAADNPFQRMLAPLRDVRKDTSTVVSGVESASGLKSLQEKLTTLQGTLNSLDSKLAKMGTSMGQVEQEMRVMRDQLQGLHEPMQKLGGPLLKVATPLADLSIELKELRALLTAVLLASIVIAIAVVAAIGLVVCYIMYGSKRWPIQFKKRAPADAQSTEPGQKV